jgi:adenylate kinase
LGLAHIASGDLFRHHLRQGTPLGRQVKSFVDQGLLVPDSITIKIVLEKVEELDATAGFMLDGFPRNTHQAEALESALANDAKGLDKVVAIQVPEAELVRRLSGRYTCRQCQAPHAVADSRAVPRCEKCGGELYQRSDDTVEAIRKRIQVYEKETVPVLEFYRSRNLLAEISGTGSVKEVNARVMAALERE